MAQDPAAADPSVQADLERIVGLARERIGPASGRALAETSIVQDIRARERDGVELEDAILAHVFRVGQADPQVSGEFLEYFARLLLGPRVGPSVVAPALRHLFDTDDLVQSVFGDLWPDLREFTFETRAQFLSLLAQRVRWKASDKSRRLTRGIRREDQRVSERPEDLTLPEERSSPASQLAAREESARLALVLCRLEDRDRVLLRLHLEGKDAEQIAKELDLGYEAARKALQRAKKRAQELIEED
jgi:RNA polymerase sigma factor (sigma-70 family)